MWSSESVYRGRTDNTMAKRKSTKGQTTMNIVESDIKHQKPPIKFSAHDAFLDPSAIVCYRPGPFLDVSNIGMVMAITSSVIINLFVENVHYDYLFLNLRLLL